jgi:hypothetical protein
MAAALAHPFVGALLADGPDMPAPAQIFAPFIGAWDLIVRWFDGDGQETRTEAGEWHFAWILEGRAIQDVWIVPPRGRRVPGQTYEYGTSLRFYDAKADLWRSTWIGPEHGVVWTFAARRQGDDVVLETTPEVAPALKWSFTHITANAFLWKNEVREAGDWRVQQTFEARRQTG